MGFIHCDSTREFLLVAPIEILNAFFSVQVGWPLFISEVLELIIKSLLHIWAVGTCVPPVLDNLLHFLHFLLMFSIELLFWQGFLFAVFNDSIGNARLAVELRQ